MRPSGLRRWCSTRRPRWCWASSRTWRAGASTGRSPGTATCAGWSASARSPRCPAASWAARPGSRRRARSPSPKRVQARTEPPMRFIALLAGLLILALALSVAFGETALSGAQYAQGLADPSSPAGTILFAIRAPRAAAAALAGGALGLAGAVMQGLLRNPLAEPGVLGVSAWSGFAAALAIALGLGGLPGAVE